MSILKKNIEFSKLKADILNNARLKECFLKERVEECSSQIINAHSLQRMGSLSILEGDVNGNQKLYTLTEKQINTQSGKYELKPIGKQVASTFFGFCGNHDNHIFEPIEQNPESISLDSNEHCFLLSFRAFAISYHRKKEYVHLLSNGDEDLRIKMKNYFATNNLEDLLKGSKRALQDMEPNKELLTNELYSKNYTCLDYYTYELSYTAPVAVSMLTSPPYLFSGKAMNISSDPEYKFSDIITSVIPLESRTLIVLAAFKNEPNGSTYLDELENMYPLPLQRALTWHILTTAENCFFSPLWYDSLTVKQKQSIIDLTEFAASVNTPFLKYNPKNFKLNLFDSKHAL